MSHGLMGRTASLMPLIGRILIGLIFLVNGLIKFSGLEGTSSFIASYGLPLPYILAIIAATVEVGAGVMLVIGFHARIAAIMLALFTFLVTIIFHSQIRDPLQSTMAMKNLAILGGLFYVITFGSGRWSLRQRGCLCCGNDTCGVCGAEGACSNCGTQSRRPVPPPMGS